MPTLPKTRKSTSTNQINRTFLESICPMQRALGLVGGRWKVLIVWYIHLGANRFSALQRAIPAISRKMLTTQLRELEADGLLFRDEQGKRPQPVEYALTQKAHSLVPILLALNEWGIEEGIRE